MKPEPYLDQLGDPCTIPPLHERVRDLEESEFQFAKFAGELLATLRLEKNRTDCEGEATRRKLWALIDDHFLPRFQELRKIQNRREAQP